MTFTDWKAVVDPKVEGSWNLHSALPRGLDFFVMVSSCQGILGTGLLSAYNAGNTYQDALARYRVTQGERAVAIDMGAVADGGFVAENSRYNSIVERNKKLSSLWLEEVYALLDVACEPESHIFYESVRSCQAIVGLSQPASWKLNEEPFAMSQPFLGHMHHVPLTGDSRGFQPDADPLAKMTTQRKHTVNFAELLAAAECIADATQIVIEALVGRVSSLVGTEATRIDAKNSMQSYGVDSISAIDLRNWVIKTFNVDMPIFEFLGESSFTSTATVIAQKAAAQRRI